MSQIKMGDKVALHGYFVREIFRRDEFRIVKFTTPETEHLPAAIVDRPNEQTMFIVRGNGIPDAYENECFEITGEWKRDKKEQIVLYVSLCLPTIPPTEEGFRDYLERNVPGIGKKLSRAICDFCKGDPEELPTDPMMLAGLIRGVSYRKAILVCQRIEETSVMCRLSRRLNKVTDPAVIRRLVTDFGADTYRVVTEEPYSTWQTIGFQEADRIALGLNCDPYAKKRIRSAVLAAMNILKIRTSSILIDLGQLQTLVQKLCAASPIDPQIVGRELKQMKEDHLIDSVKYRGKHILYLHEDFETEGRLAGKLDMLADFTSSLPEQKRFQRAFNTWRMRARAPQFHENQIEAVLAAANMISVVTGGPGTGKTTVLKAIMETYQRVYPESPITLMAPTGLAAKRMTESCGMKARTIHKTLGLIPAENASGFIAQDERKLNGLIVVDETSMIGIHLADFLLQAVCIAPDTKLVFVGDVDQLPSVTPGTFLKDIIDCGRIPVTRLTRNFRQAGGSNIADVAVHVNESDPEKIRFRNDCLFLTKEEEAIKEELLNAFLESVRVYGLSETYILTPTHRSMDDPLSSNSLNRELQELLNPLKEGQAEASVGKFTKYRVGDRVINKKNDENVINGDIGYVLEILPDDIGTSLKIDFAGNILIFPPEKLSQLELAYAITVHSSQGCEFKSVITPVTELHRRMLTKNLLYTAITRAKSRMLLIGSEDEFMASVMNVRESVQADLLSQRIIQKQNKKAAG